jgi:small subunit ribosomal protein S1
MIPRMLLPYTYRVTKYDPADRDERGRYVGVERSLRSDHGPVEAAYLAAVAAFAEDSGVTRLAIREPSCAATSRAIAGTGVPDADA